MEKNYNEQLDFILEELIEEYEYQNKGVSFYAEEEPEPIHQKIQRKVMEKFGLKEWEINILLSNLLIDKYIRNIDPLTISLEGLVFKNNGGYVQKANREKQESEKLQTIQNDFKKYSFGLMIFTAIVALGTLISAWYFAIEVYKYYTCAPIEKILQH